MADASNDSVKSEVLETRKQLEELDKNYRNLKGLSQRGKGCIVLRGISRRTRVADECEVFFCLCILVGPKKKIELFLSVSAINEFEELQEKYQECYQKASEVVRNYLFLFQSYPADSHEMRTR